MRLGASTHLGYCTNVHPGERLAEVRDNLEHKVAAVKARVCPEQPLGIGLWLSADAARGLSQPGELAALSDLLERLGLYVFTLNGFPYGAFHGAAVKTRVYEPDWRDPKRLEHSNALADLLAELLPEGVSGSISTLPGAFAPAIRARADVDAMSDNLLRHAAHLHGVFERTGKRIALALEPEPCCYLETTDQALAFFERELRGARSMALLRDLCGDAQGVLQRHLGVCVDACHAAVEFETPAELVGKLRGAAIPIVKIQLSSGLRVPRVDESAVAALLPFVDPIYLHQVVERRDGALERYLDLPDALAALRTRAGSPPPEWRVHFHVPVFLDELGAFGSTQAFLRELLALQRRDSLCSHLEVETYTWEVLPPELRARDLADALARELQFCASVLGHGHGSGT
jgi:sugar phosphate isomerase/epimerase